MKRIKFKEMVIIAVSVIILINFVYFRYIHANYTKKRNNIIGEIHKYDIKINSAITQFHSNLNILKKIALIKKDILFSNDNIELLKSAHTTTFNMSNILKTLLAKNSVSIYEVSLFSIKNKNHKDIYSFKLQINDSLKKIFNFMNSIENYSDNMYISSYTLKPKDGIYSINIIVNFDYVVIEQ